MPTITNDLLARSNALSSDSSFQTIMGNASRGQKTRRTGDGLFIVELDSALFDRSYDDTYFQGKYISEPIFTDPRTRIIQDIDTRLDSGRALSETAVPQEDYFRHMLGSFWTYSEDYDKKTLDVYKNRFPESPFIKNINVIDTFEVNNTNGGKVIFENIEFDFLDPTVGGRIREPLWDFFMEASAAGLDGPGSGKYFYDHATTFNIFEEGSNEREEQYGILNLYANIDAEYNFLQKKYEVGLSQKSEAELPNFYDIMLMPNVPAANILSLTNGNRVRLAPMAPRFPLSNFSNSIHMHNPIVTFLDELEDTYQEWNLRDVRFVEPSSKIVFTKAELLKLEELYQYREMFPMYTSIEFTTESEAAFGSILEETKFSSQVRGYMDSEEGRSRARLIETSEVIFQRNNNVDYLSNFRGLRVQTTSNTTNVYASEDVRTYYDIDDFFNNYQNRLAAGEGDYIYFNTDHNLNPIENVAFFNLMSIIARGKMEKIKGDMNRSFTDLINGAQAHNEIIFYKIEKYDEENNLIQTIHFPNTEQVDFVKLIDTQVKYDVSYKYIIKSVNLIVGTKYGYVVYDRTQAGTSTPFTTTGGRLTVSMEPSVKMLEVPLFEKKVTIMDKPPVAPDVELIPFRAVNNRVRMFLNSGIGRYMATPVIFNDEERQQIDRQRAAQDIPNGQSEIMYETDDEIVEFRLYKMEQEPYEYSDFENYGEEIVIKTNQSSSASYDDRIVPNRKYYYCVRSVDYHGNISYPSVVYEFEMVDDAGSIYPSSRIHDFKEVSEKTNAKGVKRFIGISPSRNNLFINEELMGIDKENGPTEGQEVMMGINPTAWGKKFKLRLTSKSTGRKVDFNFTFKHKDDK